MTPRRTAQAQAIWQRMPATPAGTKLEWPEDVRALAQELGFDAETRVQDRLEEQLDEQIDQHADDQLAAGIAAARGLYGVVAQIDREIQSSVTGISDLRVAAAGTLVILTGTAADDTAKNRAGAIAAQLAPDATIDNRLVVTR